MEKKCTKRNEGETDTRKIENEKKRQRKLTEKKSKAKKDEEKNVCVRWFRSVRFVVVAAAWLFVKHTSRQSERPSVRARREKRSERAHVASVSGCKTHTSCSFVRSIFVRLCAGFVRFGRVDWPLLDSSFRSLWIVIRVIISRSQNSRCRCFFFSYCCLCFVCRRRRRHHHHHFHRRLWSLLSQSSARSVVVAVVAAPLLSPVLFSFFLLFSFEHVGVVIVHIWHTTDEMKETAKTTNYAILWAVNIILKRNTTTSNGRR